MKIKPVNRVWAVVIRNSKLLIIQRGPTCGSPLAWGFPGGRIDAGECPRTAVFREFKEETGGTLTDADLAYSFRIGKGRWFFFGAPSTLVLNKTDEAVEYRWVSMADLVAMQFEVGVKLHKSIWSFLTDPSFVVNMLYALNVGRTNVYQSRLFNFLKGMKDAYQQEVKKVREI